MAQELLSAKGIQTPVFCDQDEIYIKLLSLLLVDREVIMKLYYNVSPYKVSKILRSNEINLYNFNSYLIGVDEEQYHIFLHALEEI